MFAWRCGGEAGCPRAEWMGRLVPIADLGVPNRVGRVGQHHRRQRDQAEGGEPGWSGYPSKVPENQTESPQAARWTGTDPGEGDGAVSERL